MCFFIWIDVLYGPEGEVLMATYNSKKQTMDVTISSTAVNLKKDWRGIFFPQYSSIEALKTN